MTNEAQQDAERYRRMVEVAKAQGFDGVLAAIMAAALERRRAELAEADNAALLRVGKQVEGLLADVAQSGDSADYNLCPQERARELLATVRADHPGAQLLVDVQQLRAWVAPVTEDDLTKLEQLLASAKQNDVWAWLERAREDVPKLVDEVRRYRAALAASPGQVDSDATTLSEVLALVEPATLSPHVRGQGQAVLLAARLAHSRLSLLARRSHALELRTQVDALKHQELDRAKTRAEQERDAAEEVHEALLRRLMHPFGPGESPLVFVCKGNDAGSEYLGQVVLDEYDIEARASTAGEATVMALAHLARSAARQQTGLRETSERVHETNERARTALREELGKATSEETRDALQRVMAAGWPPPAPTAEPCAVGSAPPPRTVADFLERCSGNSGVDDDELLEEAAEVEGEVGAAARAVKAGWKRLKLELRRVGWAPG